MMLVLGTTNRKKGEELFRLLAAADVLVALRPRLTARPAGGGGQRLGGR